MIFYRYPVFKPVKTATEQSTASQKKNTEGSLSTTNNVSSTSPPQLKWVTIETQRKKYQVAIASASLPGEKLEEKKQYAFDLLKELPELVSFTNLSINGTTYIDASFLSPVSAEAACKLAVSQDNPAKFEPVPEIRNRKAAPDSLFLVKIRDIPLDIDKPIFSAFLKQYGEIDSLKFHLQNLYYVAHVTYKTQPLKRN